MGQEGIGAQVVTLVTGIIRTVTSLMQGQAQAAILCRNTIFTIIQQCHAVATLRNIGILLIDNLKLRLFNAGAAGSGTFHKAKLYFNWNEDKSEPFDGTVTEVSYVSEETDGEVAYSGYISFTPDETVRLGMNVSVIVEDVDK